MPNLRFLNQVVEELAAVLGPRMLVLRLADSSELSKVLSEVTRQEEGLVVLLSHGLDGCLLIGEQSVDENGRKTPRWMVPEHLTCLAHKNVFCLACESATWAAAAIEAGASAFLGFGNIHLFRRGSSGAPMDEPFYTSGCEQCLVAVVLAAIKYFLRTACSFVELLEVVKMTMRKQAGVFARNTDNPMAKDVAKDLLARESGCVASVCQSAR